MSNFVSTVVIGKTTFNVEIDNVFVLDKIAKLRTEREDNPDTFIHSFDNGIVSTIEEVNKECDEMVKVVKRIMEDKDYVLEIVKKQTKKANGTFRKGSVQLLYVANSISQLWEESFCYAIDGLRTKAVGDTTIVVTQEIERNGW